MVTGWRRPGPVMLPAERPGYPPRTTALGTSRRMGRAGTPGSVHDGAAGEVDLARGDGAGPVGRGEDGDVGDLVVAGQMPDQQARSAGCARGAECARGAGRARGSSLARASLAGGSFSGPRVVL